MPCNSDRVFITHHVYRFLIGEIDYPLEAKEIFIDVTEEVDIDALEELTYSNFDAQSFQKDIEDFRSSLLLGGAEVTGTINFKKGEIRFELPDDDKE